MLAKIKKTTMIVLSIAVLGASVIFSYLYRTQTDFIRSVVVAHAAFMGMFGFLVIVTHRSRIHTDPSLLRFQGHTIPAYLGVMLLVLSACKTLIDNFGGPATVHTPVVAVALLLLDYALYTVLRYGVRRAIYIDRVFHNMG